MKLSLELLSYDPNYNYESDDEDEGMDTDELEQDELYGFCVACDCRGSVFKAVYCMCMSVCLRVHACVCLMYVYKGSL